MERMNQEDGKYRVLLTGIVDDSEDRRDFFCKDISERYGVSFSLLRKIITRCPIILKKNLSFKRAEALAKILMSHGALVSVEKKTGSFPVCLEFQEVISPLLALETAHLGRTEGGCWSVVGRVKNISGKSLEDTWKNTRTEACPSVFLRSSRKNSIPLRAGWSRARGGLTPPSRRC